MTDKYSQCYSCKSVSIGVNISEITFNFTIMFFYSLQCRGELIGLQYLLRQTSQPPEDMSPSSERASELLEEIEVVDHIDQDEGFVDTL